MPTMLSAALCVSAITGTWKRTLTFESTKISSAWFPERIGVWSPGRGCFDPDRNGFEQNKFDNNLKWKMWGETGGNTGREGNVGAKGHLKPVSMWSSALPSKDAVREIWWLSPRAPQGQRRNWAGNINLTLKHLHRANVPSSHTCTKRWAEQLARTWMGISDSQNCRSQLAHKWNKQVRRRAGPQTTQHPSEAPQEIFYIPKQLDEGNGETKSTLLKTRESSHAGKYSHCPLREFWPRWRQEAVSAHELNFEAASAHTGKCQQTAPGEPERRANAQRHLSLVALRCTALGQRCPLCSRKAVKRKLVECNFIHFQ